MRTSGPRRWTGIHALRKGAADVLMGAMRDPVPYGDVVQEHLFDDSLAIIMHVGHPLARRKRPGARDLGRFSWIAPRSGSPLRRQFDDLFGAAGYQQADQCDRV